MAARLHRPKGQSQVSTPGWCCSQSLTSPCAPALRSPQGPSLVGTTQAPPPGRWRLRPPPTSWAPHSVRGKEPALVGLQ